MTRYLIVSLLLIGTCSVSAFSQEMIPGFSHRHWTVDDGLPINEVFSIEQISEGYLWLSTFWDFTARSRCVSSQLHSGDSLSAFRFASFV